MDWIELNKDKPKKNGTYLCFVPTCKHYNKHFYQYKWDGHNFIDDSWLGNDRIVEATHYIELIEPKSKKQQKNDLDKIDEMINHLKNKFKVD